VLGRRREHAATDPFRRDERFKESAMTDLYVNANLNDADRRKLVFQGKILLYSGRPSCSALCDHALDVAREAFDTPEPQLAFLGLTVENFAKKAEWAKRTFTNGARSRELLRALAVELGYEPNDYYFDVPRLRIVPNYEYLHAGVSYAYEAHRDTWYGGPVYQINHWMPAMTITPEQTMAVYPGYFERAVTNSSKDFDLSHWVKVERARAVTNIQKEERLHPLPQEALDAAAELRIAGNKGDMMVFSGTHLHATVPNRTSVTRFSVDFRFFHVDDVAGHPRFVLPRNVDSGAVTKDYGMTDCFRLSDFSPFQSSPS
jgi:hypothetical protein